MAGPTGLEPATSSVTGRRSNQLSYGPTNFWPNQPLTYGPKLDALYVKFPIRRSPSTSSGHPPWADGAGDGNRTRVASLENWCTTIVLHPHEWIIAFVGILSNQRNNFQFLHPRLLIDWPVHRLRQTQTRQKVYLWH